jgi:sterol desaturase/sphingolipid hydroxylase (fatty acid hydroxylase superfamily)
MDLNPIVLSVPLFFIFIGVELLIERFTKQRLYRLQDSIANISCGITQQLSGLFLKVFAIGAYQFIYEKAAFFSPDPNTWWYWVSLFLLVDLAYYWAHRMSHEINLFWGGHVVHHQSEEYNLSVALRQSSLQIVWTFAFNLPIALLGYHTLHFALMSALNTLYQFWIHTETINKLGWFEYVFNTPSHHRVHHGRNPKYIDKNHAGTLIIWDKMFGTFQAEEERPVYGITKPLRSWNPLWANFSHYADMAKDLRRIPKWSDKIRYIFAKPGWLPEYLGGYRPVPEVDRSSYTKYDTPAPLQLGLYVLFHYVLAVIGTALFLFNQENFTLLEKGIITGVVCWVVVNCGVLFENRPWVIRAEWLRIILLPALLTGAVYLYNLPAWLHMVALAYFLISAVWLHAVLRKTPLSHSVHESVPNNS